MRLSALVRLALIYELAARVHIHIHHAFHGPPFGYAGIAAAAAASWIGVPGPGEPVLITAAVFASRHKLDITSVVLTAWAGATAGGVAGWLVGMKAGRKVLTAPGPLRRARQNAVAWGDRVFRRLAVIAVLLTPSWVAGIHHVRSAIYLPTNAVGAAAWAAGIGVGAFYLGPPILDLVQDAGAVAVSVFAVLALVVIGEEIWRRRRARRRIQARESAG